MTQKELLYLEDIYNHNNVITNVIIQSIKKIKDSCYISVLNEQLKVYNGLNKKTERLLKGESNE